MVVDEGLAFKINDITDEITFIMEKEQDVVDWFFTLRLESFIKHWLYDMLVARWHCFDISI